MDYKAIESKWNKIWQDEKLYKFNKDRLDKKYYLLEMFSYPSGAKLHMGHWYNFGLSDSFGRFKRMQGYEVFHPMGFDAFGLPAENYAIKTGIHPSDSTYKNIEIMERQLRDMGATYDWDYEIITCREDYYKWTQWLFLQLYKNGLAYQKFAPVNWCPHCNTVLANEQVVNGRCERCDSEVEKKKLTQWFFKITDYAERLLEGHDKIDWPEKTKILQKNWIDKSIGGEIAFTVEGTGEEIRTFTSRADTLFGVTYIVLAPEHPMVDKLTTPEQKQVVDAYIKQSIHKSEIDRTSTATEKTGAFTGSYVINPINNDRVPVFIGDYVIGSYGTGAVMGVAAHDTRDFDFANKYNLPIVRVLKGKEGNDDLPYTEYGTLVNSGEFDGLDSKTAIDKILEKLESMGKGNKKTNYRLRDWSVSRQRYWGCPIPIIHCEHCGAVPVKESDLPVKLPYDVDWTPKGTSPLASNEKYINTVCPICGRPAKRDPDTLDTFICSSWYFLRYPNAKLSDKPFDTEFTNKILPVDKYVGGVEHATGHLLYSRFITKFLYDKGYINFDEPFKSLVHQGMILGPDGQKMSKRYGNIVNPDDIIDNYGSDILRLYLMFGFNYIDGGPWSDDGIKTMVRFVDRVDRIINAVYNYTSDSDEYGKEEKDLDYARNYAIANVTKDFENFSFNTAVARLMEFVNALYKYDTAKTIKNVKFAKECIIDLIKMLAPAIPHIAEEWWHQLGYTTSVFNSSYPVADESKLVKDVEELMVQVNSKNIVKINVPSNATQEQVKEIAIKENKTAFAMENKTVIKTIFVPHRLINFICK